MCLLAYEVVGYEEQQENANRHEIRIGNIDKSAANDDEHDDFLPINLCFHDAKVGKIMETTKAWKEGIKKIGCHHDARFSKKQTT
jgi:hypothetical protein